MAWPGLCVDPAQPLDMSHPLNRGLVAEWSHLPAGQWGRGKRLRDLVSRGHSLPGTLTAAPSWGGPAGRPGGYGSLNFNGSTQYVTMGTETVTELIGEMTICAWVKPASAGLTTRHIVSRSDFGSTKAYTIRVSSVNAGGIQFIWAGSIIVEIATAISTTDWTFLTAVRSGSSGSWNATVYYNTVSAGTGSTATNPTTTGTTVIGAKDDGSSLFPGLIDGVMLFNSALSADEVAALYAESYAGNPNRWRWLGRRSYFFPTAAATGNRRRRILMGAD